MCALLIGALAHVAPYVRNLPLLPLTLEISCATVRMLRMILCLLDTNALAQQLRSVRNVSCVRAVSLRTAAGLRYDQMSGPGRRPCPCNCP